MLVKGTKGINRAISIVFPGKLSLAITFIWNVVIVSYGIHSVGFPLVCGLLISYTNIGTYI